LAALENAKPTAPFEVQTIQKPMNEKNSHVWAFDLGKGSVGEATRQGNKFPHKLCTLNVGKEKGAEACARPSKKCARVVGELISWALRPTQPCGYHTGFDLRK
jgi:hypothetical protein